MSTVIEEKDLTLKYISHFNEIRDELISSSSTVLNKHRQKAFLDFMDQGIPARKNENYKYTNLHPAFSEDYKIPSEPENYNIDPVETTLSNISDLDACSVFTLNGWFYISSEISNQFPKGVIITSLKKVTLEKPELVVQHYAALPKTQDDPMTALNTAFAADGYFIFVPDNVNCEKPVQINNFFYSEDNAFINPRNLVIVGSNSTLKLIINDQSLNGNKYLNNSLTEIYASEGSSIELYEQQYYNGHDCGIHSVFIQQNRDSVLKVFTLSLNGGIIRNNLQLSLSGKNAGANVFGLSFPNGKQHVDNFVRIEHASPECRSNQLYKNVLNDEATGAFAGRIHVVRDAQKTNAYQRNNNLLLTDKATMNTKPQLIIDADDVKCSHGATIGQIDEDAVFYLRTRGIPETEARLMMVNAFAHEVIQEIGIGPLKHHIERMVEKRLKFKFISHE